VPRLASRSLLLLPVHRSFAHLGSLTRELLILGVCLLAGVTLVPLLIWVVGNRALGPYTHGTNTHAGPMALLGDFLVGLSQGAFTYWLVALGPAILIVLLRICFALLLRRPEATPPSHPSPH